MLSISQSYFQLFGLFLALGLSSLVGVESLASSPVTSQEDKPLDCTMLLSDLPDSSLQDRYQEALADISRQYREGLLLSENGEIPQAFFERLPHFLKLAIERALQRHGSKFHWREIEPEDKFLQDYAIEKLWDEVSDQFLESLLKIERDLAVEADFRFPRINSSRIQHLLLTAKRQREEELDYKEVNSLPARRPVGEAFDLEEKERMSDLIAALRDLSEEDLDLLLQRAGLQLLGPLTPYHFLQGMLTLKALNPMGLAKEWQSSESEIQSRIQRIRSVLRHSLESIETQRQVNLERSRQLYHSPAESEKLARQEVQRYREQQLEDLRREVCGSAMSATDR